MERFRLEVGWRDRVKPGNIVGAIANEGGLTGRSIGKIRIYDSHTTVDLPKGIPPE
ncbi:MAG: DbpA RNA binding domain-containing protein, partial [bacterium]